MLIILLSTLLSQSYGYFQNCPPHRLLSPHEEAVAGRVISWHRTQGGGDSGIPADVNAAILLLVSHNIRFADSMTRDVVRHSYWARYVPRKTMRYEALVGLGTAAKSYDGRGRFTTFARVFVKDRILRAITRRRQEMGFILNHREALLVNRAKKIRYKDPSMDVAKALGMTPQQLERLERKSKMRIISGVQEEFFDKYIAWNIS
jgi:DNA-directed RNA polymerase sigma subunit (sigma70/sigma32)